MTLNVEKNIKSRIKFCLSWNDFQFSSVHVFVSDSTSLWCALDLQMDENIIL